MFSYVVLEILICVPRIMSWLRDWARFSSPWVTARMFGRFHGGNAPGGDPFGGDPQVAILLATL